MLKHKHHIIPRHAGGTDDINNIVELTVEDHALAHKKLYEEYGKWEDKIAWLALSGQIGKDEIIQEARSSANKGKKRTPEQIARMKDGCKKRSEKWANNPELLKAANAKRSESMKRFIRENPEKRENSLANLNWTGKTHSQETKDKLREINLGKTYTRSDETKNKLKDAWVQRRIKSSLTNKE